MARPLRLVLSLGLALLVSTIAAETQGLAGSRGASTSPVQLSTDSGGMPMFTASNLTPGQKMTRCISVSHDGVSRPGELRLTASAAGALAEHLQLAVESGTGGRFGQCNGFSGLMHYRGTLQGFATTYGEASQGLLVSTASDSATSFRFTVTVPADPRAQGASGNAAFIWRAADTAVLAPVVSPPEQSGRSSSAPENVARAPAAIESTHHTSPVTEGLHPSPVPTEGADSSRRPAAAPGTPTVNHGRQPPDVSSSPSDPPRERPTAAAIIAVVLESSQFPLLFLVLMLLFLLMQDRIDRDDPKLADAPVGPEPELEFRPRPRPQGRQR